jgi:hypothetical protein
MKAHVVFLLGLTLLIGACAAAFSVWLVWAVCWDAYDNLTGRWQRIENARASRFSVGRNCE